jgi:hypothetical protein
MTQVTKARIPARIKTKNTIQRNMVRPSARNNGICPPKLR